MNGEGQPVSPPPEGGAEETGPGATGDVARERPVAWEPLEPDYLRSVIGDLFGPLSDSYFRPRILRLDRLPEDGPLILAGNHSGSAFPYDAMVLDSLMYRRRGMRAEGKCRAVYEKTLSTSWWMRPFGIDNFWRRCGGVDMTFDNFDRLLERGERVLYFPEGVPGIGKGFQRRYQLQRFSTSFVLLAARHQAPVIPLYSVNAEWVVPFCVMVPWVDRIAQRFGVPFLPLPFGPLALLFPCLWYLALPARMTFIVGDPVDVRSIVLEEAGGDLDDADRPALRRAADRMRHGMQKRLDRYVERFGGRPYHLRSYLRAWRRPRGRRAWMVPFTWVWAFVRHARDRDRPPAANAVHRVLRDWDLFAYYLPGGWLLLSLARRLRRPPCGYRGLSKEEQRKREGQFLWHLKERPLPPR